MSGLIRGQYAATQDKSSWYYPFSVDWRESSPGTRDQVMRTYTKLYVEYQIRCDLVELFEMIYRKQPCEVRAYNEMLTWLGENLDTSPVSDMFAHIYERGLETADRLVWAKYVAPLVREARAEYINRSKMKLVSGDKNE